MRKGCIWTTVLVAMAFICASCNNASSAREYMDSYMTAQEEGDYKKFVTMQCEMRGTKCSDKDIEAAAEQMERWLSGNKITGYEIVNESIDNRGVTIIKVRTFYQNGTTNETNHSLIKKDGQWRIQ